MYDPFYNNPKYFKEVAEVAIVTIQKLKRQLKEKDKIIAQKDAYIKDLEAQLGIYSDPINDKEDPMSRD